MTKLTEIPGIGKTFEKDFTRIGVTSVEQLEHTNAEEVFARLAFINSADNHKTSKNYLYVIRMVIYYAKGGREPEKLKWSYWKD
jgi:adenine-specific DNA glycosylase